MKLLQPMFLTACVALATLAACGTNQGGGAPSSTTTHSGSNAGTSGTTGTGSTTSGTTTPTGTTNTPPDDGNSTMAGDTNSTAGGTASTNSNVANANANANDSNTVTASTASTGSGSATITGTVAGQSIVPKSAFYGIDGNTVTLVISSDPQACNAIADGNYLAGSAAIQVVFYNFTNGAEQTFGNGTYTVSSTLAKTAPEATASLLVLDGTCNQVDIPTGSVANGGSCSVTSGADSQHSDLKASFSLAFGQPAQKLSGTFEAVYCAALSGAKTASSPKSACHK